MAQYLGFNTCIIIMKYVLYCLLCLTLIQCTDSQESSIMISDTHLLLKEDATIRLLCQVSASTTITDVTGGTFTWKHTRNTGVVDNYDDNTVETIPRIRIESVSLNISAPNSGLAVFNSTADDSGIISCQYNYQQDSGSTQTLIVDTSVCVSIVPKPPICLETGQDGTHIICYSDGMCPNNDNVTLQWLDGDSMQTLNGSVTRSKTTTETNLETDINIDNYLCKLESDFYPDVQLNCSISKSTTTNSPTFNTSENVIMSSPPYDVSAMNISIPPQTFPMSFLIIAVCIGAGGMLLLIVIIITICVICRKLNEDTSKKDFEVKFELDERHVNSDNEKEDGSNNPSYCAVENDKGSSTDMAVQMHAEPPQIDTSEDALPDSSYASMSDCKDEGSGRPKMRSSVNSNGNDYAYPSILPSISQSADSAKTVNPICHTPTAMDSQSQHQSEFVKDDIPHCTNVKPDLHDMLVISEDIPVYAKPDEHIEVSNLEKGMSNMDTSDSKTQHSVRDVTGDVSSQDTPSDDMPVYAKPVKTSKVINVEEESLKPDLKPAGDLTSHLKPQHMANLKSNVNDDGGHDQAYASISLSDPTPDSCNDNTAITDDNLLKMNNDGEDKQEADYTNNNPIYFELEKS